MKKMDSVSPSVVLLPIVLMGKISHNEADMIAAALKQQQIPNCTRDLQKQIEKVLERKINE